MQRQPYRNRVGVKSALVSIVMLMAITREMSPAFQQCELTHLERVPIVLGRARLVDTDVFTGLALVDVDPMEPLGANALALEGVVLYPTAFPRTRERLERLGLRVRSIDMAELQKAEGGVTCCSLVFSL